MNRSQLVYILTSQTEMLYRLEWDGTGETLVPHVERPLSHLLQTLVHLQETRRLEPQTQMAEKEVHIVFVCV